MKFRVMIIIVGLLIIFVAACNNHKTNKSNTSLIIDSLNKKGNKSNNEINKLAGHWCFNVRDSLNFALNLVLKNDSLFGTYSCVLFNGKYLNATDEDNDWALKFIANNIFDSTQVIDGKNYSNEEAIKIKLYYNPSNDILTWIQLDNDVQKKDLLPAKALMHKCK